MHPPDMSEMSENRRASDTPSEECDKYELVSVECSLCHCLGRNEMHVTWVKHTFCTPRRVKRLPELEVFRLQATKSETRWVFVALPVK